jgi:hypothetical protein
MGSFDPTQHSGRTEEQIEKCLEGVNLEACNLQDIKDKGIVPENIENIDKNALAWLTKNRAHLEACLRWMPPEKVNDAPYILPYLLSKKKFGAALVLIRLQQCCKLS